VTVPAADDDGRGSVEPTATPSVHRPIVGARSGFLYGDEVIFDTDVVTALV